MKRATMTDRKDRPGPDARRSPGKPETAFDQWLNRGLHQMFDDVMNEPVPEELLRILREDRGASEPEK